MRVKQVLLVIGVVVVLGFWRYSLIQRTADLKTEDSGVLSATTEKTLEERMASLENRVYVLERNAGLIKTGSSGKAKEQFVQLSGGSVFSSEWAKISGSDFSLDTALYGKSVEVSWQGWIENGNGSMRIYDATNHRGVDYSEISVDSGVKSSFYSKPISIWRGQNQYYIEAKNSAGEVILSSPRLRILVK